MFTVRRTAAFAICLLFLTSLLSCRRAEPAGQTVVIFNLVSHPILDASVAGIKKGIADEGLGQVHFREINANGEMDKLDGFAREILGTHPDVIVPVSTPVTKAVVRVASAEQNIVFSTVTNPADAGITKGQPTNLTGVSDAVNYQACIDLIFELFPKTERIGMIYNAGEANSLFGVEQVKGISKQKNFELALVTVGSSADVEGAARALLGRVDALYVGSDNTVAAAIPSVLKAAADARKPVFASDAGSVEQGALAAVSVDYEAVGRRAGQIVAEILKTRKPAGQIPNVIFQGNMLVLNRDAAKRLDFTFPEAVERRASRVISK